MHRRGMLSLATASGLSLAGGGLVALLANFGARAQGAGPRVIPITAKRFVWIPDEIAVRQGETIQLEFTAPEVVMGFYCPELNLRQMIIPGQKPTVRWTAQ